MASAVLIGCGERQFVQECQPVVPPLEVLGVTAPPFLQHRRGQVRLRFETEELVRVPVLVERPGERCVQSRDPVQNRQERSYLHPNDPDSVMWPDIAGEHTLHTLDIDIAPSAEADPELRLPFSVLLGPDPEHRFEGTFRVPSVASPGVRVAFTASLAPPMQAEIFQAAAAVEPDLVVLNGDLQRRSVPESTWSGLAHDLAPVSRTALIHTLPGDREDSNPDAFEQIYLRWFGGQGRAGGTDRYNSVDLGGIRWIFLDSEDSRLGSESGVQRGWLDRELSDVRLSDTLREAVVVLHRGPYGLTDQVPAAELRENLVPYLLEHGVRLMVNGQSQLFEHYEIGGMTVLNEGGGGAPVGDPDHRLDRDPDGAALRVQALASHGLLVVDVDPEGSLSWARLDSQGSELVSGDLGPPAR